MAYSSKQNAPLTPDEALTKMEHFCGYRERCPKEVWQKMKSLNIGDETARQIFEVLEGEGYVNEARFARAFAGGKFRINRWGRVRIWIELQRRAIAPKFIEAALAEIDEQEYFNVLQELLAKKLKQYRVGDDPLAERKAAAALIRAGFEPDLVFQSL